MQPKTRRLTDGDASFLVQALHFAADKYGENAKQFREGAAAYAALSPEEQAKVQNVLVHPHAYPGLAEQFERQEAQARTMAEHFEGSDDATDVAISITSTFD